MRCEDCLDDITYTISTYDDVHNKWDAKKVVIKLSSVCDSNDCPLKPAGPEKDIIRFYRRGSCNDV